MDVMHSTLRDMEHFHTKLIQENDKLSKESEYSKVILYLVQENIQLRATNQSLRDATTLSSSYDNNASSSGDNNNSTNASLLRESSLRFDDTGASFHPLEAVGGGGDFSSFLADPPADKSSFYRHLQPNNSHSNMDASAGAPPPRTSSPDNFHTYLSTMHADDDESSDSAPNSINNVKQPRPGEGEPRTTNMAAAATSSRDDASFLRGVRQPGRLLGEIAFQLDQRILSHIFQGQTRLYGFTVHNIGDKIRDVSVHPVTGRQDDAYRRRLQRRHGELMRRLGVLGYKAALHPTFTEYVVNAYGIVEQRGGGGGHAPSAEEEEEGQDGGGDARFNDHDFLARLVESAAPGKLHKDLMVLLHCLAAMAQEDGRPLFLW